MTNINESKKEAIRHFRAAMKLSGKSYQELAEDLSKAGEPQQSESLKNKVSRGDFSAKFLFLSLEIMNISLVIHNK